MVLKLVLAFWDYDRTKAIEDGRVRVEGIDLTFLNCRVEETFYRQLRFQEFDISELSLSSYVMTLNEEVPNFIALPVFPSRFFRHQSMYINLDAKIEKPQDLKGRRIGIPKYQMTVAVWQRGIIEEEFGVPIESVEFFTGAIEPSQYERHSKTPYRLPPGVKVTQIQQGQNLSQMLADGEIDAIFSATKPSSMHTSAKVGYLFPNFKEVEADYYHRTKIFPIMHVVALKRFVYDANLWIAKALTKAFAKSLEMGYEPLEERAALRYMLPWLESHVDETKRLMGGMQDGGKTALRRTSMCCISSSTTISSGPLKTTVPARGTLRTEYTGNFCRVKIKIREELKQALRRRNQDICKLQYLSRKLNKVSHFSPE